MNTALQAQPSAPTTAPNAELYPNHGRFKGQVLATSHGSVTLDIPGLGPSPCPASPALLAQLAVQVGAWIWAEGELLLPPEDPLAVGWHGLHLRAWEPADPPSPFEASRARVRALVGAQLDARDVAQMIQDGEA